MVKILRCSSTNSYFWPVTVGENGVYVCIQENVGNYDNRKQ